MLAPLSSYNELRTLASRSFGTVIALPSHRVDRVDDGPPTRIVTRVQPVCHLPYLRSFRISPYQASTFDVAEDDSEQHGFLALGRGYLGCGGHVKSACAVLS